MTEPGEQFPGPLPVLSEEEVAWIQRDIREQEEKEERLLAVARTDGFVDWLATTAEEDEHHLVDDEALLYGTTSAPQEHPEYKDAFTHFVAEALEYAKSNGLSFVDDENPFPNNQAYFSHGDSVYSLRIMIGQGSSYQVRQLDEAAIAEARTPVIPLADIQAAA